MVDNMVNQAGMIRSVLGLPERDMVENVSQEEGKYISHENTSCMHKTLS